MSIPNHKYIKPHEIGSKDFILGFLDQPNCIKLMRLLQEHGISGEDFYYVASPRQKFIDEHGESVIPVADRVFLSLKNTNLMCIQEQEVNHKKYILKYGLIPLAKVSYTNFGIQGVRNECVITIYDVNWEKVPPFKNTLPKLSHLETLSCEEAFQASAENFEKFYYDKFRKAHNLLLKEDMKKYCGLFADLRSTETHDKNTLKELLEHAINHNNRSRQVFKNWGWLTSDGQLSANAPEFVKLMLTQQLNPLMNSEEKIKEGLKAAINKSDKKSLFKEIGWLSEEGKLADELPSSVKNLIEPAEKMNQSQLGY